MEDNPYLLNWSWIYSDAWYGLCPDCGRNEIVEDRDDDIELDLVMMARERDHRCGPALPDPLRYEEHYGLEDLKRRMGFPEDLI